MTLRMQGLLLRFLETGELQKVGADRALGVVDVRVISATNRKLEELILQGQFRDDLFYRLNVIRFNVPPLRERKADVPLLVDAALKYFTRSNGCVVREIGPEAMQALGDYSWPGNVRELQNVVERLVVTGRNGIAQSRPPSPNRPLSPRPRKERRRTVADELFKRIVDERESFWTAVYPLYMNREITKANVRDLVGKGLEQARGNYKIVARLYNMDVCDYKKFLNFLRKHECQVPFREYR
jgi:transcriptional regulator with GAF, ATPase, and Fis domain